MQYFNKEIESRHFMEICWGSQEQPGAARSSQEESLRRHLKGIWEGSGSHLQLGLVLCLVSVVQTIVNEASVFATLRFSKKVSKGPSIQNHDFVWAGSHFKNIASTHNRART